MPVFLLRSISFKETTLLVYTIFAFNIGCSDVDFFQAGTRVKNNSIWHSSHCYMISIVQSNRKSTDSLIASDIRLPTLM